MKTKNIITPTFAVTLANEDGEKIQEYKFQNFDKKYIAEKFVELYQQLRTREVGAELEYWKQDNKYAYMPMLTLEKRNDGVKRQVIKGQKYFMQPLILRTSKQNTILINLTIHLKTN